MFVLVMVSGPGYSSGDPGHGRTPGYHSDPSLLSPGSPLEASPASWVDIPPGNGQNFRQKMTSKIVETFKKYLDFGCFALKCFLIYLPM